MSRNANELRLEDLAEVKPHLITKLRSAGIESIFDLAISIPHQLVEAGGILIGADANVALDLGRDRIAIMLDSPWHAYDQTRFTITKGGVQDSEEKTTSSSIGRHSNKQTESEW